MVFGVQEFRDQGLRLWHLWFIMFVGFEGQQYTSGKGLGFGFGGLGFRWTLT